jgi:chemotaxis protein histidine kinase CheA
MKKKLEAELISIAHRILKLKNRAELEQLQEEALKLYEKLSVLKFVEDNFNDVKPTIGYASAEEKLDEIYGVKTEGGQDDANDNEVIVAKEEQGGEKENNDEVKEQPETEKETVSEQKEETVEDEENEEVQEPGQKIETVKPQEDIKEEEKAVKEVFKEEQDTSIEQVEKAEDAEVKTIEPDNKAEVEDSGLHFDFAFERKPAPEEPVKQKEISFEDFHDYKEPEFVKKADFNVVPADAPVFEKKEEAVAQPEKTEPKTEEPKKEEQTAKRSLNDSLGKTINLGLNDRIAFEKHLFGGSGEDLNRVLSQLNTFDNFDDALNFIEDLVKPDYNNWQGKEEYSERFMGLVEKKFD